MAITIQTIHKWIMKGLSITSNITIIEQISMHRQLLLQPQETMVKHLLSHLKTIIKLNYWTLCWASSLNSKTKWKTLEHITICNNWTTSSIITMKSYPIFHCHVLRLKVLISIIICPLNGTATIKSLCLESKFPTSTKSMTKFPLLTNNIKTKSKLKIKFINKKCITTKRE